MNYIIKSESKHLNLKGFQSFLTWLKIPIKLIRINLKWLITMTTTNSPIMFIVCIVAQSERKKQWIKKLCILQKCLKMNSDQPFFQEEYQEKLDTNLIYKKI